MASSRSAAVLDQCAKLLQAVSLLHQAALEREGAPFWGEDDDRPYFELERLVEHQGQRLATLLVPLVGDRHITIGQAIYRVSRLDQDWLPDHGLPSLKVLVAEYRPDSATIFIPLTDLAAHYMALTTARPQERYYFASCSDYLYLAQELPHLLQALKPPRT